MLKYTRKKRGKMEKKVLKFIKKMPKVELHLHLDGSLNVDYIKNTVNFKLLEKKMGNWNK